MSLAGRNKERRGKRKNEMKEETKMRRNWGRETVQHGHVFVSLVKCKLLDLSHWSGGPIDTFFLRLCPSYVVMYKMAEKSVNWLV
jgi:hypothetical protein